MNWKKELGRLSEKEQIDWFKKFCKEEKIKSPGQLYKKYPGSSKYYSKFPEESKKVIFPFKKANWAIELNGLSEKERVDWFIKFKEENNITSLKQLREDYSSLKIFYQRLSKENREKIFSPKNKDWSSELNGLSEEELVDWFIKFNKEQKITLLTQLNERFSGLVVLYYNKLTRESKEKIFLPSRNNWIDELNGLSEKELVDWFIKFKEEEKLNLVSQLNRKYSRLGKYYYKLSKENREKVFAPKKKDWSSELNGLSEEELVEWFIKFNKEQKITFLAQLSKKFSGLKKYFFKISQKNKEKIFPSLQKRWSSELNGLSEEELVSWFIDFIKEKKLRSISQLWKKHPGLTSYYCLLSKENRKRIFPHTVSTGERFTENLLLEAGYSFTTQKNFPDLRSNRGGVLRYDIYIKQKNCLIEFHGAQHFNPNCTWYEEEAIERDKIKYQYAIDHKINLCYITDCIKEYEKYGYFTSVFTDYDKMMEYIDSLPDVDMNIQTTTLISQD